MTDRPIQAKTCCPTTWTSIYVGQVICALIAAAQARALTLSVPGPNCYLFVFFCWTAQQGSDQLGGHLWSIKLWLEPSEALWPSELCDATKCITGNHWKAAATLCWQSWHLQKDDRCSSVYLQDRCYPQPYFKVQELPGTWVPKDVAPSYMHECWYGTYVGSRSYLPVLLAYRM